MTASVYGGPGIQPTGDTTGTQDTLNILAAISALGTSGGLISLAEGVFYWTCGQIQVTNPAQYIRGAGFGATYVNAVGTGDLIDWHWTGTYSGSTTLGGGLSGMTLDGSAAGGGSAGIHAGDIESLNFTNLYIRNFHASNASIGLHLDNRYNFTERCKIDAHFDNNYHNIVLDVSDNTGGSPHSSSSSFARLDCTAHITQNNAEFNGIVLANGALPYGCRFQVRGNFSGTSGSIASNPYSSGNLPGVFTIAGQTPAGHPNAGAYSRMYNVTFDVDVECSAGSNTPATIILDSPGQNAVRGWIGTLNFDAAGKNFAQSNFGTGANSTRAPNAFWGFGICNGDANLSLASNGSDSPFASLTSAMQYGQGSALTNSGAGTLDLYTRDGDFFKPGALTQNVAVNLNPGGTWSGTLGGPQRITIIITQASSGGPYTVTWPVNATPTTANPTVVWPGGVAPVMSPGAGDVDLYVLETYSGKTWFGNALQAVPSAVVQSLTAGDASIVLGGTSAAPTIETGTLDQIANLHPPAASWSNNSHKITSLANGSGAQDAAAFGQTPAGGNTTTIAQGGTGATTQQGALDAVAGAVTASQVLAGNGTHVTLRALVAADLPAGTTSAQGALQLDGTASDIQPTGTAASAGNKGQAADAKHVHLQNFGGIFGTASDGAVTFDGTTNPVAGATLSGSTYTLTRDVQATNIAVNSGVTVKTANFRIFFQGTLSGAGTISYNGNNASGSAAGASIGGSASVISNRGGAAGGTGVSGAGGNGTGGSFGPGGGNGGAGTSGAAGTGGADTISASAATTNILTTVYPILTGAWNYANNTLGNSWGGGGGGGGSDASSNAGGGGGASGGIIVLIGWAISFTGTISATGGNGANGTGGNAGGGGGGSGGLIFTATLTAPSITTTSVGGGTKGNGSGTGSNGVNGPSGSVVNLVVA